MTLKLIVEILSSIASLVAILVVLFAWFKSSRKALKVVRVTIHLKKNETTFILWVKNRKPYPVEIKNIRCFTHRLYKVEQKQGGKPEYRPSLNCKLSPFTSSEHKQIAPDGFTDIRYEISRAFEDFDQLLFDLDTSHGLFLLKCRNIDNVSMGKMEAYQVKFTKDYESRVKALSRYLYLRIMSF